MDDDDTPKDEGSAQEDASRAVNATAGMKRSFATSASGKKMVRAFAPPPALTAPAGSALT